MRQRAILTRVGLTGAAIAACAYAGVVGYRAWQGQGRPTIGALLASPASLEAAPVRMLQPSAPQTTSSAPSVPAVADSATPTVLPPSPASIGNAEAPRAPGPVEAVLPPAASAQAAPAPSTSVPAALQPVVAEGRTELQNGIYAVRRGDTVTVHFDTPEARTRRPEKFEQILRATLPAVHGPAAESLLGTVAAGGLIAPGETITEPPAAGISLRGRDGRALSVVPQTRPGRDGPLVVAYRVIPTR